ncbi:MAG TPA: metallopeptidase TldD-related protein [Acidimicrobiales bacterium]|nr:metallopeptidase TldD-related protein [Acidimicrobiales bacterium]
MNGQLVGALDPAGVIIERVLAEAAPLGCVVLVEDRFDADVRFANNSTTTNGMRRERRVIVAVFHDHGGGRAVGISSRSGHVDARELVESARARARSSDPAPDAAPLIPGSPAAGDFELAPRMTDFGSFGPLVKDLGDCFLRARAKGQLLAGFATHEIETVYLGTSSGIRLRHEQATGSFELVARDRAGLASSWVGRGTEDLADIEVNAIYEHLDARLGVASHRIDLPAGRHEVILPPDATADLVVELWRALSGREAEDGGNVFSRGHGETRVGERLMDLPLELSSDPSLPGIACAPFLMTGGSSTDVSVFDNGAPLDVTNWIHDGVLERLRYHRAGAKRSGQAFTPPIDNLRLRLPGATIELAELIRTTKRALLLTCLWYIREVDPATLLLTGLTRDGVYLVEDGEIVGAVNNFRFNESPLDMLRRVSEAGASTRALSRESGEWMNRVEAPPLRVDGFNMSSVSKAS